MLSGGLNDAWSEILSTVTERLIINALMTIIIMVNKYLYLLILMNHFVFNNLSESDSFKQFVLVIYLPPPPPPPHIG